MVIDPLLFISPVPPRVKVPPLVIARISAFSISERFVVVPNLTKDNPFVVSYP